MRNRKTQYGQSLVEMMIALALAMIISIAALYLYGGQMRSFYQHARKQQTTEEVQAAFEAVTTLIREADMCLTCATPQQISISYPAGVANPNTTKTPYLASDSISLDFSVPAGYAIWPDTTAPYANNTMHLSWSQASGTLLLSSGSDTASAQAAAPVIIGGSSGKMNTRIVNFDVWPMVMGAGGVPIAAAAVTDKPTAGYHVAITARVGTADTGYVNPLDPNGPMRNYRTVTYEADVLPRNW